MPFAPLIPADQNMLTVLDMVLAGLHLVLMLFVMTGWIFPAMRRAHLILLGVVWLSWLVLGLYVGNLGYCILTDWQWQVKAALGEGDLPPSYIEYFYRQVTGEGLPDALVMWVALPILAACTLISVWLNWHNRSTSRSG